MSGEVQAKRRRSRKELSLLQSKVRFADDDHANDADDDADDDAGGGGGGGGGVLLVGARLRGVAAAVLPVLLALSLAALGLRYCCWPSSGDPDLHDVFRRSDPKMDSEDYTPQLNGWIKEQVRGGGERVHSNILMKLGQVRKGLLKK